MPIYLCSGSACRMHSRRSFYVFRMPLVHMITTSRIIIAKSEAEARDLMWNDMHRTLLRGRKWLASKVAVREISREEREAVLLEEARALAER